MSNSLLPYPCRITVREDGLDYEFTTTRGTEFIVYFFNEYDFFEGALFAESVVAIGFRPKSGWVTRRGFRMPAEDDPQVFATIAWAIEAYLTQHQHQLITWVCSTLDRQEAARHALFDRKYRQWQKQTALELIKKDLELAPREFMSLVYRQDNQFRAELEALLPDD